jgi:hypothetical protein
MLVSFPLKIKVNQQNLVLSLMLDFTDIYTQSSYQIITEGLDNYLNWTFWHLGIMALDLVAFAPEDCPHHLVNLNSRIKCLKPF